MTQLSVFKNKIMRERTKKVSAGVLVVAIPFCKKFTTLPKSYVEALSARTAPPFPQAISTGECRAFVLASK